MQLEEILNGANSIAILLFIASRVAFAALTAAYDFIGLVLPSLVKLKIFAGCANNCASNKALVQL